VSAPAPWAARMSEPAPATAELEDRGGEGLAKAGIVLGMAALPILRPSFLRNLAPADLGIVLGIGLVLLWAGSTRQRLRLPFAAGVGLMVVAGTLSALFGELPWLGAVTMVQDLYLLAWAAVVANFGRTASGAGFLVNTWCVSAAVWAVGLLAVFGPSAVANLDSNRAGFTFAEENGAGLYFAMSLLVILAARRPRRWRWRGPAIGCLLVALLLTGSLGAISGLLAGLAVALVLEVRARRGPDTAIAFSLAVLLAMGSVALLVQREDLIASASHSSNALIRNSLGRSAQSSTEREVLARQTYGLWQTAGILGRGPISTEYTLIKQQAAYPKEAHNDWVAAMVERGVLGFTGLLLLVLEILLLAFAVWNPNRFTPQFRAALPAPAYLVGALATAAMYSLTHEELHERTLWTLLGLLAAFGLWGRPVRWSWAGSA
jgi:O-antigen ligase